MPEKISILKESGETLVSNVVSVFLIPDTQKRYIITTENAVDPHGLTVLHVSEIVDGTLQKVATDDEWSSIKTIMRAIISGNVGTFKYLPAFENIKASGQYSRDISVSASASKQMCDNYAAGDKSTPNDPVSANAAGGGVISPQIMDPNMGGQQSEVIPQASSIFPTGNVMQNNDNELIPGIAEVPNGMSSQGIDATPSVVQQPTIPNVEVAPVNTMAPMSSMDPTGNISVSPVSVDNVMVNQQAMMAPSVEVQPQPAEMNAGIQVAVPTQVVPTAQIAQEAQGNVGDVHFDTNATPSFAPNATLDEVVAGAQEMFMEGVKSLVQTIQEKVYRELYAKEEALKAREAELLQREKALNEQMMMVNNQGMPNMGVPGVNSVPVNPLGVEQQPMVVTQPVGMPGGVVNPQLAQTPVMPQPMMPTEGMMQPQMQMNGVVQNQPMAVGMQPVVNGPMVVSANNDVV